MISVLDVGGAVRASGVRAAWDRLKEWVFDRYYLVSMIEVPPIFGGEDPLPIISGPSKGYTVIMGRRR